MSLLTSDQSHKIQLDQPWCVTVTRTNSNIVDLSARNLKIYGNPPISSAGEARGVTDTLLRRRVYSDSCCCSG